MYARSPRPAMASYDVTRSPKPHVNKRCGMSPRVCLLIWAYLRLIVSILWSGVIMFRNVHTILYYLTREENFTYGYQEVAEITFVIMVFLVQFLEIGMIVTFIVAGHKRSDRLYRVYYGYCIASLSVFIVAVVLLFTLEYKTGHFFGEVYLTYHFVDFGVTNPKYDALIFGFSAVVDICLEVMLIILLKRLIKKYSQGGSLKNYI